MIFGQDRLNKLIQTLNINNLPHSILIQGPANSGKKLVATEISEAIHLPIKNVTSSLDLDTINSIYDEVNTYIYVVDVMDLTIKQQNMLLKIIEEPLPNCYFILLCRDLNYIIETLYNRCSVIRIDPYKKEDLKLFSNKNNIPEKLLDYCNSPGELLLFKDIDVSSYIKLIETILEKINVASFSNTLSISEKRIAFKNEKNKLDINIFNKLFIFVLKDYFLKNNTKYDKVLDIYNQYLIQNKYPNCNKKMLFENMLMNLWIEMRR